jgi:glycosyltransferase involved in cell wall biosynthesis
VALKYRLFDRVVAISEEIGRVKRAEGLPAEKLRCVHSAVDPTPYLAPADRDWLCDEFGLSSEGPIVAVVAQLIGRKGHRYLLQALPRLVVRYPTVSVLFFGKGALEQELRQAASQAGVADRVHFAGFRSDLSRILPCLDLLVHPALAEGLGVSLLQAASAGVPIVAFRAGGVPEVVRHGVNGLLVEPEDVDGLATAVETMLGDRVRARAMGLAGRSLVQREFSVDQMVEGNLAVYRELLTQQGRR